MPVRFFLLIAASSLFFGCASPEKKQTTTPAPEVVVAQKAASVAPPIQASNPTKSEIKPVGMACERDGVARTLRIESVQPKGCKLWYSNFGGQDPVASSQLATTHCERVRDQIQEKLVTAGYKCSSDQASVATIAPKGVTKAPAGNAETEKPKN